MTLEELDRADTRREYKGQDGESLARLFKYRQPFGLQFRYRHQVDQDMLQFKLIGRGQPSSGTIENVHGTWL